ncbi:hypothetical protein AN958_05598 [Leucoagaricus sp. SymC.cos]|nr:hypothetical protein AN958_05598 [Leucoagaricus sp. SymC.cos]
MWVLESHSFCGCIIDSSVKADIPRLKAAAKEGIRRGLSKSNIITELFSSFTYKYHEIIEMEVDFFLKDFTPQLAQELDEALQFVVVGEKPHCYRVLTFLMRRQRGESSESAWKAIANSEPGGLFSLSLRSPPKFAFNLNSGSDTSRQIASSSRVVGGNTSTRLRANKAKRPPNASGTGNNDSPSLGSAPFTFRFGSPMK